MYTQAKETTPDQIPDELPFPAPTTNRVTGRAIVIGLLLAAGLAGLNCWLQISANVHFLGGVHMPFGAIFGLLLLSRFVNAPLQALRHRNIAPLRWITPFSPTELATVYVLFLFAALLSTVGADNFFLTTGPALFYFTTRENQWSTLFYDHIPSWFAPGWDGKTYQREVIDQLYTGGLTLDQIPWHAWVPMLCGWTIFLALTYSLLFFLALILRRQWIENEALAFPLVQLPLQMVEGSDLESPLERDFWTNRALLLGVGLAFAFHFLRGMQNFYPDWPVIPAFQGNSVQFSSPERPWNAMGSLDIQLFFGIIGVSFLLTREVSLSFWVFFLLARYQLVLADQLGYPTGALPKDTYRGAPMFLTYQTVGGWLVLGGSLLWSARLHFFNLWQECRKPVAAVRHSSEPFSARFILLGFCLSLAGLLFWSWFAGLNILVAASFIGLYVLASIVLARLVVEGGFLFPQMSFSPLEFLTSSVFGTAALGVSNLTKLSFIQPMLMSDMRTNLLPAFLHTFKIAHERNLEASQTRRLLGGVLLVIALTLAVNVLVSIATLYSTGGLSSYGWFSTGGKYIFEGTSASLRAPSGIDATNWFWIAIGGAVVLTLNAARARFAAFPLHPLGYIVCNGFPVSQMWTSIFLGWLCKTLLLKYGGNQAVVSARPFFIGLILGNACAMVLWMIAGFFLGGQIGFWPG